MKQFLIFCLAGGCLWWSACRNATGPAGPSPGDDSLSNKDSASTVFFPVADYLQSEILYVDSTPLAIYKYTVQNNHRDTALISQTDFNKLASEFLPAELAPESLQRNYQESSFMDKSTKSATFTYSTTDRALSMQRLDVLTGAGFRGSNEVKSIYMERSVVSGDTTSFRKMLWKSKHRFQIFTRMNIRGQSPVERQLTVVWDDRDEDGDQ
jgi:hypothetical protein